MSGLGEHEYFKLDTSAYGGPNCIAKCPYCGEPCEADWVDVGVGMVQCGPYHCTSCHASEIGPCDNPRKLTPEEKKTGWYRPASEPGSSANVIGGRVVSHKVAEAVYRAEFTGNPLYHVPGYVDEWWEKLRKGGVPQ